MSPRRIVFVVIALVAAFATIFLGRAWIAAQRNAHVVAQVQAPKAKPSKLVLVARGDLHAGQFVRPDNLRWQNWPDNGIAPSYIVAGSHQLEDYVGAIVRNGIGDGEPITDERVVRPGDRGFLAAVLRPGYRAVTVALTPSQALAGLVFPGDHIDLIATLTLQDDNEGGPGPRDHHASETVLRNLRVLALDQRADDQKKDVAVAKTATLEVTPKQAEVIAVVGDIGKLSLSLRSLAQDDPETASEETAGLSYTFDSDATHLIRPPIRAGAKQKVVVVRGAKVDVADFTHGGGAAPASTAGQQAKVVN
ncbi:MAG TPA: Flp pilus assembly protein CpaB [Stellaceae bacterium]|nr:Flp pilus assembly protein CpaB [Stellaceae bacterium]